MNVLALSYTTNDNYRKESVLLEESVEKWNVRLAMHHQNQGWGWEQSVRYKPAFLLNRLECLSGEFDGMLYIDADTKFCTFPRYGDFEDVDLGAHWFRRDRFSPMEILTGSIYIRRSEVMVEFLREWVWLTSHVAEGVRTPEQESFRKAIGNFAPRLKIKDIPPEWVWIYDDFVGHYPGKSPIVEHYQASRKYRRTHP